MACIDGHNRAQGVEEPPEPMTSGDLDQLIELHSKILANKVRPHAGA